MFCSCIWDRKECQADDFSTSVTDHGVCYTFNSGQNGLVRMASQTGELIHTQVTLTPGSGHTHTRVRSHSHQDQVTLTPGSGHTHTRVRSHSHQGQVTLTPGSGHTHTRVRSHSHQGAVSGCSLWVQSLGAVSSLGQVSHQLYNSYWIMSNSGLIYEDAIITYNMQGDYNKDMLTIVFAPAL